MYTLYINFSLVYKIFLILLWYKLVIDGAQSEITGATWYFFIVENFC